MGSELEDLLKHMSPDVKNLNPALVVGRVTQLDGTEEDILIPKNKFGAKKTVVDGITFDSKKEAKRYQELKRMQEDGKIEGLVTQPQFLLQEGFVTPRGKKIRPIYYSADFVYKVEKSGILHAVVEDVKGGKATQTSTFKLKWKMLQYAYRENQFYEFVIHD